MSQTVIVAKIGGPIDKLIAYLDGKGWVEENKVVEDTGVALSAVRWFTRRSRKYFANVSADAKDGSIRLSYTPLTVATAELTEGTKIPSNKILAAPATTVSRSEKTLIWPKPPAIVSAKDKYDWFTKPSYYARLQSKVAEHGRAVSFSGPPGIGKSSAFEYLAASQIVPLVNINADSGLRLRQLVGGMTDSGVFEVAEFAAAVVNGWWAKIDEANAADPDALLAINSLLAPPYNITIAGKSYPVHPSFRLCITYNPGLIGTKPLPESLKDRFYPFKLDFPQESLLRKMLLNNGLEEGKKVEAFIKFALQVAQSRRENRHRFDITLRRLIDAWTDVKDGFSLYDSLYNTCVDRIDQPNDALVVKQILDNLKSELAIAEKAVQHETSS